MSSLFGTGLRTFQAALYFTTLWWSQSFHILLAIFFFVHNVREVSNNLVVSRSEIMTLLKLPLPRNITPATGHRKLYFHADKKRSEICRHHLDVI